MPLFVGKQLFKQYFYRMKFVCTLFLVCIIAAASARELSADSKKAMAGYNAIMHDASLPDNQLYYIECFPGTKDKFIKTLGPNSYDQLFPQYIQYLEAYKKYGSMYPRVALPKVLTISKGLVWSGGPVAMMHDIALALATENPGMFADSLATMRKKDQNAVILFMADTMNPEPFPQFQLLLTALDNAGKADLRKRLSEAYEERQQYHKEHHGK